MIGFILGLVCGCMEFMLLKRIANAITEQKGNILMLFSLKIAVLLSAFTLGVWLLRDQLAFLGIGIALPLILGSFINFSIKSRKGKGKEK